MSQKPSEGPADTGANAGDGNPREAKRVMGDFAGLAAAVLGVLAGLGGLICSFWPAALANALPTAVIGVLLGTTGYFLAARRIGLAAVILSAVALVFAVAVGQGFVPGLGPTDPVTGSLLVSG